MEGLGKKERGGGKGPHQLLWSSKTVGATYSAAGVCWGVRRREGRWERRRIGDNQTLGGGQNRKTEVHHVLVLDKLKKNYF